MRGLGPFVAVAERARTTLDINRITPTAMLFGLETVLRAFHIGEQSLWLDELFSVFVARRDWVGIVATTAADSKPPLYYFFLHLALAWGTDETIVRGVSLIFSVMTVPVVFTLTHEMFGWRAALVGTLFLTLSPFHVYFAQEARMYSQLTFFLALAILYFVRAWRSGNSRDWAMFALTTVFALYTHNLALLSVAAIDLAALLQWTRLCKRVRGLIQAHIAILILYAPWLTVLPQQTVGVLTGYWNASPSVISLVLTPYLFLFSNNIPIWLVPIALFSALALLAFGLVGAVRVIIAKQAQAPNVLFVILIFVVPLLLLYVASFLRPIYVERTLIAASIGLYPLLGWTVAHARPHAANAILGGIVVLTMVVGLMGYYSDPAMQKPPMREAAARLGETYLPGDAVVHTSDASALAFKYNRPDLPNLFLEGDPDYVADTSRGRAGRLVGIRPVALKDVVINSSRLWLVVALDHNEDYQRARVWEFDALYPRVSHENIGGIDIILYKLSP